MAQPATSNSKLASLLPFSASSDAEVLVVLKKHRIGLTVEEARKICTLLKRNPTLTEATIWGVQGSEHCSYKSSRRFLKTFPTTGKHVILGPGEDSGIVAITDAPKGKRWGLVISHESHNHPSQIVPYEGAATGVGGVVRDVVCMGARVIGALDMLRLGDLASEESRTIAKEVTRGIAGYGNPLGVPNLGGDTVFDASYNSNCLVNAAAVGIVREDEIIHSTAPEEAAEIGYDIIVIGKPTDRSGFGGASFASASMEADKKEQNSGAVQEPNPFLERHLLASTYALFDWLAATKNLHRVSFKDHGAGGNVCATVEQVAGREFGAEIDLEKVHIAIKDLPPEVIGCAETQERLCWVVHPELTKHILKHYNVDWDLPSVAEGARASVIGKVNGSGIYRLTYRGEIVCEARSVDITSGLQYVRPTEPLIVERQEPVIECEGDKLRVSGYELTRNPQPETFTCTLSEVFHAMLVHPNGCSREAILKHYDKTVIGNSIIEAGEADAGVIMPLQDLSSHVHEEKHPDWELPEKDRHIGVALAADGNGRYGRISPYWQGANAATESMRNLAATGATPRALTDCLNYGNPEIPGHLWALEEGIRGIGDAARGVAIDNAPVPIISGNVSLYNSKPDGSSIDPTAVVCAIGVMPDAIAAASATFRDISSLLYYIGDIRDECGGSLYYQVLESMSGAPRDALLGKNVPEPDFVSIGKEIVCVAQMIQKGIILSAHDVSEGGLALALFEMTIPQRRRKRIIGADVRLDTLPKHLRSDTLLFSQSGGFIVEVPKSVQGDFEAKCKHAEISPTLLGQTQDAPTLRISREKT
ncbi:MAG: phosphoribosylformylglycinamidine synthase II, partial [Candidatus Peregrinibacteria bacterium Greene0416_62]